MKILSDKEFEWMEDWIHFILSLVKITEPIIKEVKNGVSELKRYTDIEHLPSMRKEELLRLLG